MYHLFDRMHTALANSAFVYRCVEDEQTCREGTAAFVNDGVDPKDGTTWEDPSLTTINMCPVMFAEPLPTWQKALEY